MQEEVNFVKTTIENYYKAPTHSANNIYFTTDTKELFVGEVKYGSATIMVDDTHPLPVVGREGYLYIDKSNGLFSIKVWDDINKVYVTLPLADTSYVKTISRRDQTIVGAKGDGNEDIANLDDALDETDIDSLFVESSDEENVEG